MQQGHTSLRNRLYERIGFSEGLRRLAKVFPDGSAADEIERRLKARLRKGDAADRVEDGVVEELARELLDGHGLGLILRPAGVDSVPVFTRPRTAGTNTPLAMAAE